MKPSAFDFVAQIEAKAKEVLSSTQAFSQDNLVGERFVNFQESTASLQISSESEQEDGPVLAINVKELAGDNLAFQGQIILLPHEKEESFLFVIKDNIPLLDALGPLWKKLEALGNSPIAQTPLIKTEKPSSEESQEGQPSLETVQASEA